MKSRENKFGQRQLKDYEEKYFYDKGYKKIDDVKLIKKESADTN